MVAYSTDHVTHPDLDDSKRFMLWRDWYEARCGSRDFARPTDRRFRARFEFAQFGAVGLGAFEGTINQAGRTPHDVRVDGREAYFFLINTGSDLVVRQHDRETRIAPGDVALISYSETGSFRGGSENSWISMTVSQKALRDLVSNVDDLLARPLDQESEALKHLRRYIGILLGPDGVDGDATLTEHVGKSLLELMALSLGAGRDMAETGGMRSLRAARTREIVAEIKSGFSDPSFSLTRATAKLRLSERYIQDLLAETGASFTERVMEARLQSAKATLESRLHDRLAISEIAYACGFNEVSYFNRCFRRRFATSPGEVRRRTA
jgi:AraC-like DNA-binding protein